jgi:hypothetical protein
MKLFIFTGMFGICAQQPFTVNRNSTILIQCNISKKTLIWYKICSKENDIYSLM